MTEPLLAGAITDGITYLLFGGAATTILLLVATVLACPLALRGGVWRWARAAKRMAVFAGILFLYGLPANVLFTRFMRDRFYADNDPILDWLPWVPSGDWIIDWACQGHYMVGASAWTLRLAWAVLALPVWTLTILTFRALQSRSTGRRTA